MRRNKKIKAVPSLPLDALRESDLVNVIDNTTEEEANIFLTNAIEKVVATKTKGILDTLANIKTHLTELVTTIESHANNINSCTPASEVNNLEEGKFAVNENGVYVYLNGTLTKLV